MAAPEGVTAVYDNVVISVYGSGGGFGIRPTWPVNNSAFYNSAVGTVYKIGSNVYNVIAGDKVGFKTECMFATNDGQVFATVNKNNILITYVLPP